MLNSAKELGWCRAEGEAWQIGLTLGRYGRDAVHRHLIKSPIWQTVNAPEYADRIRRLTEATQARFPQIWAEIEGLAEGLMLPVEQVMAWNCRGDLLASSPDGCTTVQLPGPQITIAHNEDGLPFFRGACFIADICPEAAPGFRSFCYPGSIPGHTFAITDAGLVQAVNNLRLKHYDAEIPRMVLGRAILSEPTLDAAVAVLRDRPQSGGFHLSLAQVGDPRLLSVEFGGGECSVRNIDSTQVHANHALHLPDGLSEQIITCSSRDRQARGNDLIAQGTTAPLTILRDVDGPGLPIRRDAPDDPDCENTLATAVFIIGQNGIEWSIYDRIEDTPTYHGKTQPA